jgi:rare lipoprotein A
MDKQDYPLFKLLFILGLVLMLVLAARDAHPSQTYRGTASWYGRAWHGRKTASGERFNRWAPTLACRHLPFGSRVRITNLANGRSAVAVVNDRGPFCGNRMIDVSEALATRLGFHKKGLARVKLTVLSRPRSKR